MLLWPNTMEKTEVPPPTPAINEHMQSPWTYAKSGLPQLTSCNDAPQPHWQGVVSKPYWGADTFILSGYNEPPALPCCQWRPCRELDFHTHLRVMRISSPSLLGWYQRRHGEELRLNHFPAVMRPSLCRVGRGQVDSNNSTTTPLSHNCITEF